jgi:hypothetical protein
VAAGSGIAGATSAWAKTNLAGGAATGPVSIAGASGQPNATALAGWLRTGTAAQGQMIGSRLGTVAP